MESNEVRIKACLLRHPDWTNRQIRNSLGVPGADVVAVRMGSPIIDPPKVSSVPETKAAYPASPAGGFSIKGILLLSKKPADCMKARLYGLRRGMGYKIEDLSKQWGVSTETLRKHAKDHNALVYVEATPGEYVACIVHPETPKGA